jgi:hypothetical protein
VQRHRSTAPPAGPTRRQAAPASPRGTAGPQRIEHLEPADALALQQHAGNRAVLRTLRRDGVRRLQRAETGLKEAGATTAFATSGVAFWKDAANADKPLKDFAVKLLADANAKLRALGSFEVKSDFSGTGAASGSFGRGAWSIAINTALFSDRAGVTKVGQLTLAEAAEIADTIWHEMRHSEQYFRIARMRAATSTKTTKADIAKEIKDGMDIPADVALAAANAPLAASAANTPLLDEAKQWESITLGFHSKYKNNITAWILEARDAQKSMNAVTAANLVATRGTLAAFVTSWGGADRGGFIDTHLPVVEAIATKSALDTAVIGHLKAIKPKLTALQAAWKIVEDNWATDTDAQKLAHVKGAKAAFDAIEVPLYAAYRAHLHEKDAWDTGAAAGAEFRRLGT